ncbi:MFS transporter [Helicobacter sp. 11S03491-1]|uniref:MFS transporter n=1 Tax=Helicobacter sp. 11S03491-1 TaxID=1476196 RepID=UPI000BA52EC3|nr:MFS transporter [Helicobacter sp. 11S03491-1]PAF41827.1 hypothetical protein BKH45_05830 [Helicobacter sp. 11S03491-1]
MLNFLFHSRRIGAEVVIFMVYAVFSVSWSTTGSLMPQIQAQLGINTQQASFITTSIVLAKIFGSIFTGFLVYKFGLKKGYFLGCLLISSGIFLPFVDSYLGILIIRFLTGLGSACALICLVPIAQQWFSNKALSIVLSLNISSQTFGTIFALIFAEAIAMSIGNWKLSLSFYAWINLILMLLWLVVGKDQKNDQNTQTTPSTKNNQKRKELLFAFKSPMTWGMIIHHVGPLLFLNVSFTFLPDFYTKYTHLDADSINIAKIYVPVIANIAMIISPYIGVFLKKKGIYYKNVLIISDLMLVLCSALMFFVFKDITGILITTFFAGIFSATWVPYIFSLPSEVKNSTPTQTHYVMSIFWAVLFSILTINMQIIAYSVDRFGNYNFGFGYFIIFTLICAPISWWLLPNKKYFEK